MSFTIRSWLLVFALVVSGCSVEISQTTIITPTRPAEAASTAAPTSKFPTTHVPVIWDQLDLTGKLIYLTTIKDSNSSITNIQMLDLVTGDVSRIYSVSEGWIYYATVSPDAKWMLMSYISSSSNRALYIMPMDAAAPPQLLFTPPTPDDHYTQAEWSPDGKYIYYVHYNGNDPTLPGPTPDYDILRMTYPNGQSEKIAEHAFWPRLSPDSTRMVYVSQDLNSDRNGLFLANADGSDPQRVVFSGPWIPEIVDAPIFSPDGQSIFFSVPTPSKSYQPNWFEKVLGIQVAKAHSVPSDWWSVPSAGGEPTQLTKIQTINLFASMSPDQHHLASVSGDGLFVMDLDGANLTMLVSDPEIHGTVGWIP